MSAMIRPDHSHPPVDHPSAEPAVPLPGHPHDVEAPDRGEYEREAPESRVTRQAEAPDAGEGRMGLLEHEFTHGRSQS